MAGSEAGAGANAGAVTGAWTAAGAGVVGHFSPSQHPLSTPPSTLSVSLPEPSQNPPSSLSAPTQHTHPAHPPNYTLPITPSIPPAEHTLPSPPGQQPMPGRSSRVPQSLSWDMPLQLWKNMCFFLVFVVIWVLAHRQSHRWEVRRLYISTISRSTWRIGDTRKLYERKKKCFVT